MKNLGLVFAIMFLFTRISFAQKHGQARIDSLLSELPRAKEDTNKAKILNSISSTYSSINPDEGIRYAQQVITLSEKLEWKMGICYGNNNLGVNWSAKANYPKALEYYQEALELAEQLGSKQEQARNLSNIGSVYERQSDYSKALSYTLKALKMSEELGDKRGIIIRLCNIGNVYNNQGNYFLALDYYSKGLKMAEETANRELQASILINIGNIYKKKDDDPQALNCYLQSLKMAEQLGNKNLYGIAIGNVGIMYKAQGNYTKALDYDLKALKMAEQLGDKASMVRNFDNLGSVYGDQVKDKPNSDKNKNDSLSIIALNYYSKALKMAEDIGDKQEVGTNLNNVGVIYKKQGNYTKALDYYLQALQASQKLGEKNAIAITLSDIGSTYIEINKLTEAEKYLHNALLMANDLDSWEIKETVDRSLNELYIKRGDWKNAYSYYKAAAIAKDSINNEDKAKAQTRLEMNYEFDKKQATAKAEQDKKDVITSAEIGKQKVIRNATAGGGGILVLSSIFIFFFYKRRNDARRKQKEAEFNRQVSDIEMKALRAQMNPHFVFNSLQSIQTFLLQKNAEEANTYLIKFSKLMRLVLENSQHAEVPLKEDILALELYLQLESLRLKRPFTYSIKVDEDIDEEITTVPPLILQPFVENAIWHGLQYKNDNGHINIYITKKDGALMCTVEDNGVGRETSKTLKAPMLMKKESLGMKLTQERLNILSELKKVKAYFNITDLFNPEHKASGTRVELFLPLAT